MALSVSLLLLFSLESWRGGQGGGEAQSFCYHCFAQMAASLLLLEPVSCLPVWYWPLENLAAGRAELCKALL